MILYFPDHNCSIRTKVKIEEGTFFHLEASRKAEKKKNIKREKNNILGKLSKENVIGKEMIRKFHRAVSPKLFLPKEA